MLLWTFLHQQLISQQSLHATEAMSAGTDHPIISSRSSRECFNSRSTSGTKTASTVEANSPMIKYGIYLIDIILGHRTYF
jgi:hypothetical protein